MAEIRASLRIMGLDLDPEQVTAEVGILPDHAHKAGDSREAPPGRQYADYREGLWAVDSTANPAAPLEEHIRSILARFGDSWASLGPLSELSLRKDIFVGIIGVREGCGISLPSDLMKAVGELGLSLDLDLYG